VSVITASVLETQTGIKWGRKRGGSEGRKGGEALLYSDRCGRNLNQTKVGISTRLEWITDRVAVDNPTYPSEFCNI
jgi:hypothetical protein